MLSTLSKGIRILELFTPNRPRWRLSEISRELGINKTAVFRVVRTLEHEGYLYKDPADKRYTLTAKLLGLSSAVLSQYNIVERAKAAIEELWTATQGTIVVRVFESEQLVTVAVRESPLILRVSHSVGTAYPFNFGAIGKAVMAYLPEEELEKLLKRGSLRRFTSRTIVSVPALLEELKKVRRCGYAVSDEEAIEGVRAVGAPLFDPYGRPIGGISVGLPTVHFPRAKVPVFGKLVRDTAAKISASMGFGLRHRPVTTISP